LGEVGVSWYTIKGGNEKGGVTSKQTMGGGGWFVEWVKGGRELQRGERGKKTRELPMIKKGGTT